MPASAHKNAASVPSPVKIPLDQIDLGDRLRDPNSDDVKALQVSMAQIGLMTPISVRAIGEQRFRVIYGAHRLLAALRLREEGVAGWTEIDAFVVGCDADEALLREIDENLIRIELSPYDQAEFLTQRLRVWEEKYGSAKRGGDQKSKSKISNLTKESKKPGFFEDAERQIGLDQTTIRLAIKRRQKASPELWARLRGTDVTRKGVLLDRLLKSGDPGAIIDLAEAEFDGSIEAALNKKAPKEKKAPSVERILKIIDDALELWSDDERKRFAREMRARK